MVFVMENLVPSGHLGWIKLYSYFYDGHIYDYGFPAGDSALTERQAEERALREECRKQAEKRFLEDVLLRGKH